MADKDIWFRYAVVAGRFSAWPVNAKGWAALIVVVALPVLLVNLAAPWVMRTFGAPGLVGLLLAAFAVTFPTVFALVRAKGEKVKP